MQTVIKDMVMNNGLEEKILLHGAIYDQKVLKNFFAQSIACISPNQAGLSVLMSMGYGVPFLTSYDAITGGEIFNIENNVNGFIYNGSNEELKEKLLWITDNRDTVLEYGRKAKQLYDEKRKPIDMANAIRDSVEYVLNKN